MAVSADVTPPAPPRKARDAEQADGARDITPAELRAMIQKRGLQGAKGGANGLRMPDEMGLAELCGILAHWRQTYFRARNAAADAALIRRAEKARDELLAEIPALLEMTAAMADADPFKLDQARRIRAMADALGAFAVPPAPVYHAPGVPNREIPHWRWIVRVLREDFARHLGRLGTRDDGPAARGALGADFWKADFAGERGEVLARCQR